MAYKIGRAKTIFELLKIVDEFLVDNGWERKLPIYKEVDSVNTLVHCIWKNTSLDDEKTYIQIYADVTSRTKLVLDMTTSVDPLLEYWEQTGSISQWAKVSKKDEYKKQPCLTIADNSLFYYWLFVNKTRLIVVCRESIDYESAYLGLTKPTSFRRQYAYPAYVSGNALANGKEWPDSLGSFLCNGGSSFFRRPDGTWYDFSDFSNKSKAIKCAMFPYNVDGSNLVTHINDSDYVGQREFFMMPIMLPMDNMSNAGVFLDDVYWISGARDIATEEVLTLGDERYIVFDTKRERDANSYFLIRLA